MFLKLEELSFFVFFEMLNSILSQHNAVIADAQTLLWAIFTGTVSAEQLEQQQSAIIHSTWFHCFWKETQLFVKYYFLFL